jgi:hypothetical protein
MFVAGQRVNGRRKQVYKLLPWGKDLLRSVKPSGFQCCKQTTHLSSTSYLDNISQLNLYSERRTNIPKYQILINTTFADRWIVLLSFGKFEI